jgi:hypothetical protein
MVQLNFSALPSLKKSRSVHHRKRVEHQTNAKTTSTVARTGCPPKYINKYNFHHGTSLRTFFLHCNFLDSSPDAVSDLYTCILANFPRQPIASDIFHLPLTASPNLHLANKHDQYIFLKRISESKINTTVWIAMTTVSLSPVTNNVISNNKKNNNKTNECRPVSIAYRISRRRFDPALEDSGVGST